MPPEAPAAAGGVWDRFARLYDRQLPLERRALRAALDMADVRPEERLLDLATGTGALLRTLADRGAAPREAVGVDSSAEMLAAAPALPAGWHLRRAAVDRLPFADGSFDVVAIAYLLHLLERPERASAIAEARRVLRPGGRLVAVTVARPASRLGRWAFAPLAAAARRSVIMAGLRPLDPRQELAAGGLAVRRARRTGRGYPSLVVLAERRR